MRMDVCEWQISSQRVSDAASLSGVATNPKIARNMLDTVPNPYSLSDPRMERARHAGISWDQLRERNIQ